MKNHRLCRWVPFYGPQAGRQQIARTGSVPARGLLGKILPVVTFLLDSCAKGAHKRTSRPGETASDLREALTNEERSTVERAGPGRNFLRQAESA